MESDNFGLIFMLLSLAMTLTVCVLAARKGSFAIILLSLLVMFFYSATFKVYRSIIRIQHAVIEETERSLNKRGVITKDEYGNIIKGVSSKHPAKLD